MRQWKKRGLRRAPRKPLNFSTVRAPYMHKRSEGFQTSETLAMVPGSP
jgi:hypothetical protein